MCDMPGGICWPCIMYGGIWHCLPCVGIWPDGCGAIPYRCCGGIPGSGGCDGYALGCACIGAPIGIGLLPPLARDIAPAPSAAIGVCICGGGVLARGGGFGGRVDGGP